MNLTYPRRSRKSLLRSVRGPGRGISDLYSRAYRRGSASYRDSYGYGGRSPRRALYSRKTSFHGVPGSGPATSSKNHDGSPLYSGVRDIRDAPYGRNGPAYIKKITRVRVRRAWKRKTCLLSFLYTIGRYYI